MAILDLKKVTLTYPGTAGPAVRDVDLSIEAGEIHALVGESGCGKSSTIRMIAGLEIPTKGEIYCTGRCLNRPGAAVPAEERKIGMVFQDNALFPHLTVAQNVLFGVKDKSKRDDATLHRYLQLTGLEGLQDRYPHEISGGQMQRVALARALAPEPELILMDEPFNNLDIRIKRSLLEDIGSILRETETTCLFITHEKSEAFIMADRISVMRKGCLLQTALPEELYRNPRDTYVAEFFGRANHIQVWKSGAALMSPLGPFPLPKDIPASDVNKGGYLIHRPWDTQITENGAIKIIVEESFFFGDYQEIRFRPADTEAGGRYKFFTHISRKIRKNEILRINILADRLSFCAT